MDHSSVTSSPRLIAGSYVLHRLLVPRHPPCALTNLTNKDARVHCAVLKLRAVIDPTPAPAPPPPKTAASERYDRESVRTSRPTPPRGKAQSLKAKPKPDPSGPNSVPSAGRTQPTRSHPGPKTAAVLGRAERTRRQLTDVPPLSTLPGTLVRGRGLDATPHRGPAPDAP